MTFTVQPVEDFSKNWREDIKNGMLIDVVLMAARRHITTLEKLSSNVLYRDKAIADMKEFLREYEKPSRGDLK